MPVHLTEWCKIHINNNYEYLKTVIETGTKNYVVSIINS